MVIDVVVHEHSEKATYPEKKRKKNGETRVAVGRHAYRRMKNY